MDKLYAFYSFLDLAGTFAFAISGAAAARQRGLDLFGICAIALYYHWNLPVFSQSKGERKQ